MDVTAIGRASVELAAALAAAFERGRDAHAGLELAGPLFDEGVLSRVRRRMERAGIPAAGAMLSAAIERLAAADLYLAIACDERIPSAWERFDSLHRPRLCEQARRAGADAELAEELAAEVLAELCAPADSGARTRLGRYDGAGSLDGWLAVVVRHRLVDRARARPSGEPLRRLPDPRAPSPPAAAISVEASERFAGCVRAAFSRLTPKEALAVQFRYADDLPLRRIAGLLGVGEPRVSRLVQAGVERLREWMRRCWQFLVAESGGSRPLADLLHEVLAAGRGAHGSRTP